jgi:hypothetical protein
MAVALSLAVVVAPMVLASVWSGDGYANLADLRGAVGSGLVHYWAADTGRLGPDLERVVDHWRRFHLVKAVLSGMLLVVLLELGSRLATAYVEAPRGSSRLLAGVLAVADAVLALIVLLVVMANVQGAAAPLSSALGLLPLDSPDRDLASTITQIRHDLAGEATSPAQAALVHDFAVYHAAMAGLAVLVSAGLVAVVARSWRRHAATPRVEARRRRVLAVGAPAAAVSATVFVVVAAANITTVLDPAPALLAFFDGGR